VKAVDLWPKFARFGRVGEVYIPERRDKQGKRFGFVKYRDVKNAREQLDLISNIWFGSFKIRVNIARFNKGDLKREEEKAVTGKGKEVTKAVGEVLAADGRSFKEVLSEVPGGEKRVLAPVVQRKAGAELGVVVMEVEPEAEALKKLNGAYVGFLSEFMHHQTLQRDFVMDGYHNIVVTPLSHLKVLLSSSVVGEVHDLVGSVGWWCNCFEKFEAWSPNCVSNRRVTWLYCFGVPLHVWGDAIFRSLGFKFGTFIETDEDTKQMRRGDVAKVRIETELPGVVDASILISVMGQNFSIRAIEQVGGTGVEGLKFGGEGA
jgi:hypothetical protein